jgi:hypothetical protein
MHDILQLELGDTATLKLVLYVCMYVLLILKNQVSFGDLLFHSYALLYVNVIIELYVMNSLIQVQ